MKQTGEESWPGWVLASAGVRSVFELMQPVEPDETDEDIEELARQWGIEPWQTFLVRVFWFLNCSPQDMNSCAGETPSQEKGFVGLGIGCRTKACRRSAKRSLRT